MNAYATAIPWLFLVWFSHECFSLKMTRQRQLFPVCEFKFPKTAVTYAAPEMIINWAVYVYKGYPCLGGDAKFEARSSETGL